MNKANQDVLICPVEGNGQWLDGGSMFGNAPRAVWEKWVSVDDRGRIPLSCRSLLIEVGRFKVLLEVGVGSFFSAKLADRFGVEDFGRHRLLENLKELGVAPEDIDFVILSHLHFDHAGGLLPTYDEMETNPNWELCFPKAKYIVGSEAWERALNPHPRDRASFLPVLNEKLAQSGRLCAITLEQPLSQWLPSQLVPHLEFFMSNGHTPGQLHTVVKGKKERVIFAGDLVPGVPWVHIPITMGYDRFAEKVIDEKHELYNREVPQQSLFFFTHDRKTTLARLTKNDKGRYEASKKWNQFERLPI